MVHPAKVFAVVAAIGLVLPLVATSGSFARGFGGHGAHIGGGAHFGGFHAAHFGGFHGAHFGGFHAAHFGGFHHFGGLGSRHIGGLSLGARRFGGIGGRGAFGHHRFVGAFGRGHGAFAHAAFARAHFGHNAFGGRRAWGWNRGGYGGYGDWAGPVYWPYLYGDLLSFALWPDDYYDPFFGYGPDYLLSSVFWPGPYEADLYGWDENPYEVYASAAEPAPSAYLAKANESCAALAPGIADLPVERIKRAIDPNETQSTILTDLKAASAKADGILQASCPSETPLTPVARLDAMGNRIGAMLQAVQITRAPLTTLDNSLDDKQRERFNAIALGERARRRETPAQANGLADLCADQAKNFANLPIDQIEQTVKPDGQQQTSDFTALKNASAKAATGMNSSCPTSMPQTLTDRFNAITTRLDAMAGAVKTIEPALKDFYASLNDDQKARFNVMAPANASQTTQR